MQKITKKEGQLNLMKGKSKLVLTGYVSLNKANELLDMENKKFIELTKDISYRQGIKFNNNEVVFEILDGINKGKKSWLSSLTKTKWYLHSNLNGNFIVIDFSEQYTDKDFNMCMAYQLFQLVCFYFDEN